MLSPLKYALEGKTSLEDMDSKELRMRQAYVNCERLLTNRMPTCKNRITPEQQLILTKFFQYLLASKKCRSALTVHNQIKVLHTFGAGIKKPFGSVTKDDMIEYFASLEFPRTKKKGMSHNTLIQTQTIVRKFFAWVYGCKKGEYPDMVNWMEIQQPKKRILSPDMLLDESEILKMVCAASHERDKALVMVLNEGALRPCEVSSIRIRNVFFDEWGAIIKVDGKTGERCIRFVDSVPYIKTWLDKHPYKNNQEAYVFCALCRNKHGMPLTITGIYTIIQTIAKRAKIEKHIWPYLSRHTRINNLGKMGFNERDKRLFAGWTEDSNMPNYYEHYGQEEVDRKLLRVKGIIKDTGEIDNMNKLLMPKVCPYCNHKNEATALFCSDCQKSIDSISIINEAKRTEEANVTMNELFANPEFKEMVKQFLSKKNE